MPYRARTVVRKALLLALAGAQWNPAIAATTTGSLVDAIRRNDLAVARRVSGTEVVRELDETGTTPLMYAALCGTPDVLRVLIERGAPVNASNRFGATALMWAATSRAENLTTLLALGADVDARTRNGRTALLTATRYGNTAAMRALLAAGADTADPQMRRTLLTASVYSTDPTVRDVLREARIVASAGSDLTGAVLDWTRADRSALNWLLTLGVSPMEQTPLFTVRLPTFFMAVRDGHLDAVRAFVGAGADPSAIGMRGWTALMLAVSARRPSIEMLQYLLEHGGNVNATDDAGRTVLDWALTRGESEVSAFLRRAGARANAAATAPPVPVATPRAILDAVQRSVGRLQPAGPAFSESTGCVSCHNQSVPGMAITLARARGVKLDRAIASHSVVATEESTHKYRDAVLTGDTVANVAFVPYGLLERVEAGLPATVDTDAMIVGLASRQTVDGSWQPVNEIRPPINGSAVVATALSIRALRAFAPPVHRASMERRAARGRAFLEKSLPDDTQDRAFKLLGLLWAGASAGGIGSEKAALFALQRADGGWGQLPTLGSDAYATGEALYALHAAGVRPTAAAYRNGVEYLLRTQLPDGTWFVRTRAFPVQKYFESGFPHGPSQFISTAATGWATMALAYTLDAQYRLP
ncbi:MAG: ankyrin repeat domain-containing protein [Acidobacteriota bacterium]